MIDATIPQPDKAAILAALQVMFDPADVIELRAFHKGRKRIDSGYFDSAHWPDLADLAAQLSTNGSAVYVTLNPVDPQLLGRYSNRVERYAKATTTDMQVIRRRWLLIDLDPVRPSDTSASEAQLDAARLKAGAIYKHLEGLGWPAPQVAKSGNGYHLLYAIDLPNDDIVTALLKSVLQALGDLFDDANTKVDRSVFNAARICKLYGTVANKGDNTTVSPWRLSTLVQTSERMLVSADQLRSLQSITPAAPNPSTRSMPQRTFNLEDFLARHGLEHSTDMHDGRERFKLKVCPFNNEHVNGEAAVFRDSAGKLGFHCMHDSCNGNNWQRLRDLLDGPRQQRAPQWGYESLEILPNSTGVATMTDSSEPEETDDQHRNAPKPSDQCLYGLIGDLAREAAASNREVNPFAAGLAAIVALSAGLGRSCYLTIGDDWHHPRVFGLHVGRSGRGRKGTSTKLMKRLVKNLLVRHPDVGFKMHTGGLSSREGLAMMIHDGFKVGKNEVEPIYDKRLFVIESEFVNVLHQGAREGNTLSSALRDAWDGSSIKPATKTTPVHASDPHINLLGHITPGELTELMRERELTNGFANRFLMIWAEQPGLDPMPSYTTKERLDALTDRVAEVLRFAKADRFAETDQTRMVLSEAARQRYQELYCNELQDRSAGERLAGLMTRRAPYLLRLAMLFALTDLTHTIEVRYLDAAMAWIRYWADSVKFIFASAFEEQAAAKTQKAADAILDFLSTTASASRTEIMKKCFQGHTHRTVLDAALDELLHQTPPAIEVEAIPRQGGRGSGTKVYRKASAKSAKSAKSVTEQEFEPDSDSLRNLLNLRNQVEAGIVEITDFAQFADFANKANSPESEAGQQNSHNSQISQGLDLDVEIF